MALSVPTLDQLPSGLHGYSWGGTEIEEVKILSEPEEMISGFLYYRGGHGSCVTSSWCWSEPG